MRHQTAGSLVLIIWWLLLAGLIGCIWIDFLLGGVLIAFIFGIIGLLFIHSLNNQKALLIEANVLVDDGSGGLKRRR